MTPNDQRTSIRQRMQGVAVVPMGPSLEMDKAIQNEFSEAPEQDPLKKKKKASVCWVSHKSLQLEAWIKVSHSNRFSRPDCALMRHFTPSYHDVSLAWEKAFPRLIPDEKRADKTATNYREGALTLTNAAWQENSGEPHLPTPLPAPKRFK